MTQTFKIMTAVDLSEYSAASVRYSVPLAMKLDAGLLLINVINQRDLDMVQRAMIGSYGWGGKTVETLAGMIPNLKVEVIDPVLCKGIPLEDAFKASDDLAAAIAQKHKENGFTK
ncbi:hypothetical protein [Desulfosarcina sp.]|uniref:hypothetical protein n=1 Tax=Desulfosarcina sp. TaxID=2027861 RepID=UPI0029A21B88|nr:hypothetical protein [Desulfosarcina sp.]MDX2454267.1 hypothetical protein [Desulfosarcina sp.]